MTATFGQSTMYAVLLTLCWITVSARVYVRKVIVRSLGSDDYLMIFSLCCLTALISLQFSAIRLGLGQHISVLPREHVIQVLRLFFGSELIYIVSTVTIKLSIAIMLLRFAQQRSHRLIIVSTVSFYTVCGLVFMFVGAFQCWPVAHFWDPAVKGSCISKPTFTGFVYTSAAITLVTDGIFAFLPTLMIWDIQMDRRTKFCVGLVLGLGISTSGFNIARFTFLGGFLSQEDMTFRAFPIVLMCILEVAIGIMAASLATLRPLICSINHYLKRRPSFSITAHKEKKSTGTEVDLTINTEILRRDVEAWCEICMATQQRANEENRHQKELLKPMPRVEDGTYHISQEVNLPEMLRCNTNHSE